MASRLLRFFGFGDPEPVSVPDSLTVIKINQSLLASSLKVETKKALDVAIKEAAKTAVEYWLYETDEGKAVLKSMVDVSRQYPATDKQIKDAVSKAVLSVFQGLS